MCAGIYIHPFFFYALVGLRWAQNATAISRVAEAAGVTIGAGSVDLRPVAAFLIVMFLQVSSSLLLARSRARSLSLFYCLLLRLGEAALHGPLYFAPLDGPLYFAPLAP